MPLCNYKHGIYIEDKTWKDGQKGQTNIFKA